MRGGHPSSRTAPSFAELKVGAVTYEDRLPHTRRSPQLFRLTSNPSVASRFTRFRRPIISAALCTPTPRRVSVAWLEKARDELHRRGLPGAVGSEKGKDVTVLRPQRRCRPRRESTRRTCVNRAPERARCSRWSWLPLEHVPHPRKAPGVFVDLPHRLLEGASEDVDRSTRRRPP